MIVVKMSSEAFIAMDVKELITWCDTFIGEGKWNYITSTNLGIDGPEYFEFMYEEDATAFKLRFEL
jgi:hypothetical protein